jgi:hypothetical protein
MQMASAVPELMDMINHWDSLSGLLTGKGTHVGSLCQQNNGAVKIKQKPATMVGRNTRRTLPPKRTPFQIGNKK